MRLRRGIAAAVAAGVLLVAGCSGGDGETVLAEVAPTPRRTVVWLEDGGIDAATAAELSGAGVDQLVVRRGAILLSGRAPVVQLMPRPLVEGPIPAAVALEVRGLDGEAGAAAAEAVWAALEADLGVHLPPELVLDLPVLGEAAPGFVRRLAEQSGLAVVPVLSISQLETEIGRKIARTAHQCVVPLYGPKGAAFRGVDDVGDQPLRERLAAVRDLGIRVRVAVALRPTTQPEVAPWAEDVNALTGGNVAEIRRTSALDRSFSITKPVTWAGSTFGVGDTLSVAWVDAAKLHLFLGESQRVVLPEIAGWDLISLPPEGPNLGLDRAELIRYLAGEGPAPAVDVAVSRSGRSLTVRVSNPDVFRSAVTGFGNWVQVELARGALVASSRGDFDRVILGSTASGRWQPNPPGGPDAVRFMETYIAPGEALKTGTVRLPSRRSSVTVRWQIQLSDGSTISGVVE